MNSLPADSVFADFLQRFGALAAEADSEEQTTAMARLFWFTVEFGLVQERGKVRGNGRVSSFAHEFNLASVLLCA